MYLWYQSSAVCYAYLADVPDSGDSGPGSSGAAGFSGTCFRRSKWFTRGWTLQELIAPKVVVFLSAGWRIFGSKSSLDAIVQEITGIDRAILTHQLSLDQVSVAKRMSWAAKRQTTRVEDMAYSLLGIFDINMPTLYGEGRRAFRRLQEEIVKRIPDQSIFAWGWSTAQVSDFIDFQPESDQRDGNDRIRCGDLAGEESLFASSPALFASTTSVRPLTDAEFQDRLPALPRFPLHEYTATPFGIRLQIPMVRLADYLSILGPSGIAIDDVCTAPWHLVLLACEDTRYDDYLLARVCFASPSSSNGNILRAGWMASNSVGGVTYCLLSAKEIKGLGTRIRLKTAYIPHPMRTVSQAHGMTLHSPERTSTFSMEIPEWASAVLGSQGYQVTLRPEGPGGLHLLELTKGHIRLSIDVHHHAFSSRSVAVGISLRPNKSVRTASTWASQLAPNWSYWRFRTRRLELQDIQIQMQTGNRLTVCLALDLVDVTTRRSHLFVEVREHEDSGLTALMDPTGDPLGVEQQAPSGSEKGWLKRLMGSP